MREAPFGKRLLEKAALPGQGANRSNVGYAEGKQVLIVVADDVVLTAKFEAEATAIRVVADLIHAECHLVVEEIIILIRCYVKALPICAS